MSDGDQEAAYEQKDYSQNALWSLLLERLGFLKKFLGMMASNVSINFGGMHHRGSRYYTLEFTGCLYLIMYFFLIKADIQILSPVINNKVARVGTDKLPLGDEVYNPTLADFTNQTKLMVKLYNDDSWKELTCDDLEATFYTEQEDIPLSCIQKEFHFVEFFMPLSQQYSSHYDELKLFYSSNSVYEKLIDIECKIDAGDYCRTSGYYVEVIYQQLQPSAVNGTDQIMKNTKFHVDKDNFFNIDIMVEKVNVKEIDSHGNQLETITSVQIEQEPDTYSLYKSKFYRPGLLGEVYLQEQSWQNDIHIYRENWVSHLAYIGCLNLFWILLFNCVISCFVKNQFNSSLRNEVNPQVVKHADLILNTDPISTSRRKFFSKTAGLSNSSTEEILLDQEMAHHLSLKNFFEMSKLAQEQKEQINYHQNTLDVLQREISSMKKANYSR